MRNSVLVVLFTVLENDRHFAVKSIEPSSKVPVSTRVAVRLPGEFHRDPADRIIVAQARELNALLLSADEKIRNYTHVQSVW